MRLLLFALTIWAAIQLSTQNPCPSHPDGKYYYDSKYKVCYRVVDKASQPDIMEEGCTEGEVPIQQGFNDMKRATKVTGMQQLWTNGVPQGKFFVWNSGQRIRTFGSHGNFIKHTNDGKNCIEFTIIKVKIRFIKRYCPGECYGICLLKLLDSLRCEANYGNDKHIFKADIVTADVNAAEAHCQQKGGTLFNPKNKKDLEILHELGLLNSGEGFLTGHRRKLLLVLDDPKGFEIYTLEFIPPTPGINPHIVFDLVIHDNKPCVYMNANFDANGKVEDSLVIGGPCHEVTDPTGVAPVENELPFFCIKDATA